MKLSLMVTQIILIALLSSSTLLLARPAVAATHIQPASQNKAAEPVVVCLPGVYYSEPGDCVPAGPSEYLTQMARKGITFPLIPLAYQPTDPTLAQVNVRYAEVTTPNAPVYGSVQEAVAGNKKNAAQRLNGYFVFVSYINEQEVDGKRLYQVGDNSWMRGADLSRIGALPRFQGVTFNDTPLTSFGWVLTHFAQGPQLETKRTPGYKGDDYTGRLYNLYDIVPVFSEQEVDGELWYMLGPDEWAPKKYIARVIPNPIPPEGVTSDRWIEVNLFEQTLSVYDNRKLVFATVIASGADPFWTRPGVFQIYQKHEKTPMTGSFEADRSDAYYLEDVPWTLYYDGARALHGAYWRAKMGFAQSHGCINMTVGDAHWVYDWAQIGDWVYVWDPSGKTPTDPNLYSSGGY